MSQNFTKKELRQLLTLVTDDLNHCEIYGDFNFTKQLLNKIRVLIYRYDEEYEKLVKINKLLRELLRENETDLKNIASAQGVWKSSKDGGRYCP